jgi:hypothetical protein
MDRYAIRQFVNYRPWPAVVFDGNLSALIVKCNRVAVFAFSDLSLFKIMS